MLPLNNDFIGLEQQHREKFVAFAAAVVCISVYTNPVFTVHVCIIHICSFFSSLPYRSWSAQIPFPATFRLVTNVGQFQFSLSRSLSSVSGRAISQVLPNKREREREAEGKKKAVEEEGIKTSREGEGEGEEGSGGGRKEKLPEEEMLHNSGVDVHVVLTCHFAGMCPTPPNLFIAFVCHLSHSISLSPSHSLTAAITPISLSLVPHQKCR